MPQVRTPNISDKHQAYVTITYVRETRKQCLVKKRERERESWTYPVEYVRYIMHKLAHVRDNTFARRKRSFR